MTDRKAVSLFLEQLGMRHALLGFLPAAVALELLLEDESRSHNKSHDLYPAVGQIIHASPDQLVRNIRTMLGDCWAKPATTLRQKVFAGFPHCPGPGTFLDECSAWLLRHPEMGLLEGRTAIPFTVVAAAGLEPDTRFGIFAQRPDGSCMVLSPFTDDLSLAAELAASLNTAPRPGETLLDAAFELLTGE